MKRFWSFIVAGIVGFSCIGSITTFAEDKKDTCSMEFYSHDGIFEVVDVPYTLTIEKNGRVYINVDNFDWTAEGYFEAYYLISSKNGILYDKKSKEKRFAFYPHFGYVNEYRYSTSEYSNPNKTIYIDDSGKTFYKNGNEKIYFTDTVVVEFAGKTYTKEFGVSTNSPTVSKDNNLFGDINEDGCINASDAVCILRYSAYLGTGGTLSLEDFIGKEDN